MIFRSSTRISHSMSLVEMRDRTEGPRELGLKKDPVKYVMLPAMARKKHPFVEDRLKRLASFAETFSHNKTILADDSIGIITSGVAYQYAKEVMPNAVIPEIGHGVAPPGKDDSRFRCKGQTTSSD